MSFTELDPMSSPSASLPLAILATSLSCCGQKNAALRPAVPVPALARAEDPLAISHLQPQREDDLPLRVHPALGPLLHTIDGQHRNARPPRQLGLGQQQLFAKLLHVVRPSRRGHSPLRSVERRRDYPPRFSAKS